MAPLEASRQLAVPFVESPFLESELAHRTAEERARIQSFAERGYLIIDSVLPDFDPRANAIVRDLAGRYPETDRRIDDAWYFQADVRELSAAPVVIDHLRALYGREPIPFQTLNFDAGTEQPAHSDLVHFHSSPRHFMAGVWIALEDIDSENGPLFVYPGSHLLPDFDMATLGLPAEAKLYPEYEKRLAGVMEASGIGRQQIHLRRGQAIIWATNLVHGGSAMVDRKRTRHSQVTHYYFEDCVYFFPLTSEPFAGRVTMREVTNIRTGKFVPHHHLRHEQDPDGSHSTGSYKRPLPEWVTGMPGRPDDLHKADRGALEDRVRQLKATVADLRKVQATLADLQDGYQSLQEENARVYDNNREKDAFIKKRDDELAYKIARRITKTLPGVLGRKQG